MSLLSGQITVGTSATEIPVTSHQPWTIEIKNDDNTDAVYVGGPAVTTSNGLRLAKQERIELSMNPGDRIYLVSTQTGHSVSYLKISKAG